MTEIVLYGVPVSAFVAKVRIALDHKGLAYREAPPPEGYGSVAYRAIIPAGSVPGVVIDGRPLHDSNAIVEYLEDIAPEPPLLPADPYDRARARALLGYHDTRLEAAARMLFPVVKGDWRAAPAPADAGVAALTAALDRLDVLIDPAPFAFGDAFSIADAAYPTTIQMAQMLAAEVERPLILPPNIAGWTERVGEVEAVARSLDIARTAMNAWLASFRR